MKKPIKEIISKNQNYKAVVFETEENPIRFEALVYQWSESLTDDEGKPLWERVSGPFILDDYANAEIIAKNHLKLMAGETPDQNVDYELLQEATEGLGHENFEFLEVSNFEVFFLPHSESEEFKPLKSVQKICAAGELYYVEDQSQNWWTGFLYDTGIIRCWQKSNSLKNALAQTQI